jgi:hypothetical protein
MTLHPLQKAIYSALIVILLVGVLPARNETHAAPSAAGVLSLTIPGLDFLGAWIGRDVTYKNAEQFIEERNQYYDNLRSALRSRFKDYVGDLLSGAEDVSKINPMRDSQVAAYRIQVELIEQQRKSALAFAEAVKKGAKRSFDQALKREIQDRLMSTDMLRRVFGAITSGLGQAQNMVNLLNNQLDELPGIQLQQLRTLADQVRAASGVFNGPNIDGLVRKLQNLSSRLRANAGITREELNEVNNQIGAVKSRLEGLAASGEIDIKNNQVLGDLGLQLLGFSDGTPATQAILNLLSRRHGVSYAEIRTQGLALLAAGDKARCREKAEAILQALRQLAEQQGEEIEVKPPSELCNEINAERLLDKQTSPAPASEQSGTASGDGSGNWNGAACDEAEGTYVYRWAVSLLKDPATGKIKGTVKFHNCPGGGRALYRVNGDLPSGSVYTLVGEKRDGGGTLFDNSPDTQTFTFDSSALTIDPNFAP